jgi:hypothetical protein
MNLRLYKADALWGLWPSAKMRAWGMWVVLGIGIWGVFLVFGVYFVILRK